MLTTRPYALSIAGFDPSAGAGLLADVKTMEQNGVYAFGVVSALTLQNDITFKKAEWLSPEKIISQVEILLVRFPIKYIKIGLMKDMEVLYKLLLMLHRNIELPVIIYDPILKASAGYEFYTPDTTLLDAIYERIYCITPNIPEAQKLLNSTYNIHDTLLKISERVNIYLKGGHADTDMITDTLYTQGNTHTFTNPKLPKGTKHGSGCVLSASLTAHLALGKDLVSAANAANAYTHRYLASNDSLLGYHS